MHVARRTLISLAAALGIVVLAVLPAQAAPSQQDQNWLVTAHQGNLAEIAAGQAALQQSSNAEVRDLGQMIIDDHQRLDADVTAAAGQLGVTLPGTPNATQQAELAQVSGLTGEEFDRAWIAWQITAHRQALAAGEQEVASGSDPAVTALAAAAAPVIQSHLDMTLALAQAYGVPTSVAAGNGGSAAESSRGLGLGLAAGGLLVIVLSGAALVRRARA